MVLDAAFRGDVEHRRIAMRDLILSTKTELQKQERLPTKAEFEDWHELVVPQTGGIARVGS